MNQNKIMVPFLIVLAVSCLLMNCKQDTSAEAELEKKEEKRVEILPVEVTGILNTSISATYYNSANLKAEDETDVVSRSRGIVKQVFKKEGSYVKKGEILAKLDDADVLLKFKLEQNRLAKIEAVYKRKELLLKKDLVSKESFEQILFDYNEQKIACDMMKLNLAYTEIRAPISGIITVKMIIPGNMVSEYQAVFRVTSFKRMYAEMHVPEIHSLKIKKGQKARLTFDALGLAESDGVVSKISPVIDPATGTFKVTVKTENPAKNLKPGMFARILITYDTHKDVLTVPSDALIYETEKGYIFVADDNKARKVEVITGYKENGRTEVTGPELHDQVIVTGFKSLKDGSEIMIVKKHEKNN